MGALSTEIRPPMPEATLRAIRRDLVRGLLAAGGIGMVVNLLYLAMPFYMLQVYDRVVPSRSHDTLIVLTGLVLLLLVFLATLDFIRGRVFAVLAERLARRLGAPVLAAAVEAGLSARGQNAPHAMRDLAEVQQFVASGPAGLPLDLLVTPAFVLILFLIHPAYGTVGVIAAALLTGIGVLVELLGRRPAARAAEAQLVAQGETASAIRHAEVITAMGMLPAIAARWRHAQAKALATADAGRGLGKAASAVTKALRMGLQVAMLATGALLVIDHAASPGSIAAAAVIMGRLLLPFEQLIEGWRQWLHVLAATGRLRALLGAASAVRSPVALEAERGSLVVDRLSWVPEGADRPVLRQVSLRLEPGEVLGIVGPSGAGKSTLARMLVGLWRPTAGGVYLDGHDTHLWERASFGRAVGYLPQSPSLLDGTVRENIARFQEADPAAIVAAARAAGVHELIGRLPQGYETRISEASPLLSGGQRQRLALARALFGTPRLLVLDEPNANLDAEGEQAFIQAIRRAKAQGTTVVIVAQRMSILTVADQLLVLREGAVAQLGPRDEVLRALAGEQTRRGTDERPEGAAKVAHLPMARRRGA